MENVGRGKGSLFSFFPRVFRSSGLMGCERCFVWEVGMVLELGSDFVGASRRILIIEV